MNASTSIADRKTTKTEYTYGDMSQITAIKVNGTTVVQYEYDGLGRRTSTTFPDAGSVKLAATGTTIGMGASKALNSITNVYQKAENLQKGTTDVYRSVSTAELVDIQNTGQFNLPAGGMEAKQFAFSYAETLKFGSQSIINQTDIVRASIPNSVLDQFLKHKVDSGIFTDVITVYYEQMELFNEYVANTIKILSNLMELQLEQLLFFRLNFTLIIFGLEKK